MSGQPYRDLLEVFDARDILRLKQLVEIKLEARGGGDG
jgi:hypothetical protein